ncbi:MAG: 7-cyano-7-deazaguanine synthase [Deltaproteobacteria bacterium]|nr:7-cyano-7-deazaguanine synthase [Deltaproteobacteria bacterium]
MKPFADTPTDKLLHLERIFKGYGSVLIAFSGGVDSTFLLAVAKKILSDGVVAVTCVSPFHPAREIQVASELAESLNVPHRILHRDDIGPDSLVANTKERCYLCKKDLASQLIPIAAELGIETTCARTIFAIFQNR